MVRFFLHFLNVGKASIMSQKTRQAPKGFKWIYTRYRKVRGNPNKVLDAHEYGHQAWCFLVRTKG